MSFWKKLIRSSTVKPSKVKNASANKKTSTPLIPIKEFTGYLEDPIFSSVPAPIDRSSGFEYWGAIPDATVDLWKKVYASLRDQAVCRIRLVCVRSGQELLDFRDGYYDLRYSGQIPLNVELVKNSGAFFDPGERLARLDLVAEEVDALLSEKEDPRHPILSGFPFPTISEVTGSRTLAFPEGLCSELPTENRSLIVAGTDADRVLLSKIQTMGYESDIITFGYGNEDLPIGEFNTTLDLNLDTFRKLLIFFYPNNEQHSLIASELFEDIEEAGLSLENIVSAIKKLQPYEKNLESMVGIKLSAPSISSYALEIGIDSFWNKAQCSDERNEMITSMRNLMKIKHNH